KAPLGKVSYHVPCHLRVQNIGQKTRELLEMIPGVGRLAKELDPQTTEKQLRRIEAIICSMTPEERRDPSILNASRRRRIAAGSGTTVQEVNDLLRQFREMQRLMKQLQQSGRRGGMGGLGRMFGL
ncbi:MAG: hypothetical protein NZP34_08170, partial [Caldilineales bacterium]|nr:hypothetical protein [Caldilineales bacterium]